MIHQSRYILVLVTATLGLFTFGCGDGDGDGDGPEPLTTNIDAAKPLDQLDVSEARTLCEGATAFLSQPEVAEDVTESVCMLSGAFSAGFAGALGQVSTDAALQALCQQEVDSCLADGSATTPSDCSQAQVPTCSAPVSDLVDCFNTAPAQLRELAQLAACSTLTIAQLTAEPDPNATIPTSPACTALQQQCPDDADPGGGLLNPSELGMP